MICSFEFRNIVDIQDFSLLVVAALSGGLLRLLKILIIVDLLINIHVFNLVQVVAEVVLGQVGGFTMMSLLDLRDLFSLGYHLDL
jgi:hypothetical protein